MKIKLFDPTGIKPDDYRHKYPELERTEEFVPLTVKELIFVWYYANPTSSLVLGIVDDYERVAESLRVANYNPSKTEKENILRLQFSSDMAIAIKKMQDFDAGIRFRAYKMTRTVFDEYEKIITTGPKSFDNVVEEKEGKEKDKGSSYIDRYVVTSNRIIDALPTLLSKIEEGFGIVDISGKEVQEEEGFSQMREWHQNKENK